MFTIKAVKNGKEIIRSADSFTVLRDFDPNKKTQWTEITLHGAESARLDLGDSPYSGADSDSHLGVFDTAYIMNDKGQTVATFYGYQHTGLPMTAQQLYQDYRV
jgi:hypothetical protein